MAVQGGAVMLFWTDEQWNGRRGKKNKKHQHNVILLHFNLQSICEEDEDEDDYKPVAASTLMFVTFADR